MNDQTIDLNPGESASEACVRISVVKGPHQGMHWLFDRPTEVMVGRDAPSNLILRSEQALSRQHFRLNIVPPIAELIDEGSRNGTTVNGVRVAGASLHDGDRIVIGDTEIIFEVIQSPEMIAGNLPELPVENIAEPKGSIGIDESPQRKESIAKTRIGPAAMVSKSQPADGGLLETAPLTKDSRQDGHAESGGSFVTGAGPDSTQLANGAEPATGDGVGSYELLQLLGRGGMASVYRAKHRRTDQLYAVKLIRSDLPQSDKQLQLFVREAGVLTQLEHPRIVKAVEFGIEGRMPYLVMEHIDTVDLLELIDAQPPEKKTRTAIWTVSRILQALHYAHQKGFVHRDVKPANILAYREKHRLQVKLADFGLAKMYVDAGFSGLTDDRSVRGTVAYMAPEQFENSRGAGPAEDVFSCGACLYRLVTGNVPNMVFKPQETLAGIHEAKMSNTLRTILQRSLNASREQRFNSAEELAAALQQCWEEPA